jgi:hypothetical protein
LFNFCILEAENFNKNDGSWGVGYSGNKKEVTTKRIALQNSLIAELRERIENGDDPLQNSTNFKVC